MPLGTPDRAKAGEVVDCGIFEHQRKLAENASAGEILAAIETATMTKKYNVFIALSRCYYFLLQKNISFSATRNDGDDGRHGDS